jgi:hypothetical protein
LFPDRSPACFVRFVTVTFIISSNRRLLGDWQNSPERSFSDGSVDFLDRSAKIVTQGMRLGIFFACFVLAEEDRFERIASGSASLE